jgi:hypothetical protein
MKTPGALPTCSHGKIAGSGCFDCYQEDEFIRSVTKKLVDDFWDNRGNRDLTHLMLRAYRMGMKHGDDE